jgi:prolyl oligopeptidase
MKLGLISKEKYTYSRINLIVVLLTSLFFITSCKIPWLSKPDKNSKSRKKRKRKGLRNKYGVRIPVRSKRRTVKEIIHNRTVKDPYRWLEAKNSKKVKRWMKKQDKYARKKLRNMPFRRKLRKRIKELSYIDWKSAPTKRGQNYFFARRHKNREKVVYYWKTGKDGNVSVLLDPNTMSTDGTLSIKGIYISYDGKKAAYKISKNNADSSILKVLLVETGEISKIDTISGAKYASPSWDADSKGFYYTRLPNSKGIPVDELPGHAQIYYHRLGKPAAEDILIFDKTGDPTIFINPQLSKDGRYLLIYKHFGWSKTEILFKDMRSKRKNKWKVLTAPKPVRKRRRRRRKKKVEAPVTPVKKKKIIYSVEVWKNNFYILTNYEGADNYRIFKVNPRRYKKSNWKEIVAEKPDSVLKNFKIIGNKLALTYINKAASQIILTNLNGKNPVAIPLPGKGKSTGLKGNPEDNLAYFDYSSFLYPKKIYSIDVKTLKTNLYFETDLDFDPEPFKMEQVFFKSKDGTKISMYIIRRKTMEKMGKNPFILYGYGGFNVSLLPKFSARWATWLDMGGSLAVPNLRGGGEYGEAWHKAGMLTKKQNVFDDFIAAAKYLINNNYTSKKYLAIMGGSNGGLLVGAAMVQRPELFRVVSCHVPLLDMIRYHKFGSGRTWISEYGSADNKEQFKALIKYSPYHNIKKGTKYPSLLMMSADSDDRVDPMHARKFVAAIQWANKRRRSKIILRIEKNAGHGGGDMVKKRVKSFVDEFSFIMKELRFKRRRRRRN